MLKSIGKFLKNFATGASAATVFLMWVSAYSAHISPASHGWLDVLGLCFPIFAAGNAIALAGWLLARSRRAIIPLVGFVCCFSDLRAYCPVNFPQPIPKGSVKIMSYNTMNFACSSADPTKCNEIINDIIAVQADVVCIQEGQYCGDWEKAEKKLRKAYPYLEILNKDSTITVLRCFSRYPIVGKRSLPIISAGNSIGVFIVDFGKGDTAHIMNCHLQSDGLTREDKSNYKGLVNGEKHIGARMAFSSLVKKLSAAAQTRSMQVDSISAYLQAHAESPIIVCGDFNDSPISYTRRKIAQTLTDTYKVSGNGPGFTYNRDGMYVRIDHILCSEHWKPYETTIIRSAKYSDHYPICTFLKRKPK